MLLIPRPGQAVDIVAVALQPGVALQAQRADCQLADLHTQSGVLRTARRAVMKHMLIATCAEHVLFTVHSRQPRFTPTIAQRESRGTSVLKAAAWGGGLRLPRLVQAGRTQMLWSLHAAASSEGWDGHHTTQRTWCSCMPTLVLQSKAAEPLLACLRSSR